MQTIENGEIHDAIHSIQEMLAGTEVIGITEAEMHLKLALSASRIDDALEAEHHVEHYLAIATDHSPAEKIITLLRAGDISAAEHELESLLGGTASEAVHEADDDALVDGDEHEDSDNSHSDDDSHVDGDEHEDSNDSHSDGDEHEHDDESEDDS